MIERVEHGCSAQREDGQGDKGFEQDGAVLMHDVVARWHESAGTG